VANLDVFFNYSLFNMVGLYFFEVTLENEKGDADNGENAELVLIEANTHGDSLGKPEKKKERCHGKKGWRENDKMEPEERQKKCGGSKGTST